MPALFEHLQSGLAAAFGAATDADMRVHLRLHIEVIAVYGPVAPGLFAQVAGHFPPALQGHHAARPDLLQGGDVEIMGNGQQISAKLHVFKELHPGTFERRAFGSSRYLPALHIADVETADDFGRGNGVVFAYFSEIFGKIFGSGFEAHR